MLPRLEGLLLGRALVVTVLLGAAFIFQYSQDRWAIDETRALLELSPIYGCVVFVYILSIGYAAAYRKVRDEERRARQFGVLQIVVDTLVVSYLLVVSGGARSVFSFLYLLIVIYGGTVLGRRGAFFAAVLCSFVHTAVLVGLRWLSGEWLEILARFGTLPPSIEEAVYAAFVNLSALFLVAALMSYLTERLRRTGEALARREIDYRALEALHQEIVTNLTSGIITVGGEEEITYLNRAAEQMLGRRLAEVYRLPLADVFPDIARAAEQGRRQDPWRRPEVRVEGAGGIELELGFSVSGLKDARGRGHGEIIIFQDLTNLKRAEERLRRVDHLATVGELAASIAHEIRNPLASISGSIELLGGGEGVSEEDQRLMRVVQSEIARLDTLISNFLHYSRPLELKLERVNLRALIKEAVISFGPQTNPPIEVVVGGEAEPVELRADPDQLKQVLWNLLINARQALEPQGGRIEIALFRSGAKGPAASCGFSVRDTGHGISEESRRRLFMPFFTTRSDGTGLGLALVDRIVGLHGGKVRAENAQGGGARFTVTLPVEPPHEEREKVDSAEAERAS